MIRSAVASEVTIANPAFAKQPASVSPSAMFEEQPKLLTKIFVTIFNFTLVAVSWNKNVIPVLPELTES